MVAVNPFSFLVPTSLYIRPFPSLAVLSWDLSVYAKILAVIAAGIVVTRHIFRCCQRPSPSANEDTRAPPPPPSRFHKALLYTCARLCRITYSKTCVKENASIGEYISFSDTLENVTVCDDCSIRIVVPSSVREIRSSYEIVQTYGSRTLWLFRTRDNSVMVASWILVFRGTQVLDDVYNDFLFVLSVATNRDCAFQRKLQDTIELLNDVVFPANNIIRNTKIHIVGHSLGATFGEAVYRHLLRANYTSVTFCGFDSPGLPEWYRQENRILLLSTTRNTANPHFTLVYGNDNIVNNLTSAPREALCYRVGETDPNAIPSIRRCLLSILLCPYTVWKILVGSLSSHELDSIGRLLHHGKFEHDTFTSNRRLTGTLLRFNFNVLYTFLRLLTFGWFRLSPRSEIPMVHNRITRESKETPPPFSGLRKFQGVREIEAEPDSKVSYALLDFDRFEREVKKVDHMVFVFIAEKVSETRAVLNNLFDIPSESTDLVDVEESVASRVPHVMLYKYDKRFRQWLIFLPVHSDLFMESYSFVPWLHEMRSVIYGVIFISPASPTPESKRIFAEICSVAPAHTVVAYNNSNLSIDYSQLLSTVEWVRQAYTDIMVDTSKSNRPRVVLTKDIYFVELAFLTSTEYLVTDPILSLEGELSNCFKKHKSENSRLSPDNRSISLRDMSGVSHLPQTTYGSMEFDLPMSPMWSVDSTDHVGHSVEDSFPPRRFTDSAVIPRRFTDSALMEKNKKKKKKKKNAFLFRHYAMKGLR